MAIYHFTVKNILRTEGRSVTAAAAYRAAEKINDSYTGLCHDYSRKKWCIFKEVLLPVNAQPEYVNRETLWNAVEWAEDMSGRIAREIEFSLPRSLSLEQWKELAHRFIQENCVDSGMIADWVIHDPPVRDSRGIPLDAAGNHTSDPAKMIFRNPHVHCLLTVRPLDAHGKFLPKSQKEYVCKNPSTGEERPLISSEFVSLRDQGWEKEFRYTLDGQRIWLTPSEAEAIGLQVSDRVFKNPRATMRGRENPKCAKWNSEETLREWRKAWADAVNSEFERLGIDNEKIDHRSFVSQGREGEIPEIHLGPAGAHATEGYDDRRRINEEIREHNRLVREGNFVREELDSQVSAKAAHLASLRAEAALATAAQTAASASELVTDTQKYRLSELEIAERELLIIEQANATTLTTIRTLLQTVHTVGSIVTHGSETLSRIAAEREKIRTRDHYAEEILKRTGCENAEAMNEELQALRKKISSNASVNASPSLPSKDELLAEYKHILESVPEELRSQVQDEIGQFQSTAILPEAVDTALFTDALQNFDEEIASLTKAINVEELSVVRSM